MVNQFTQINGDFTNKEKVFDLLARKHGLIIINKHVISVMLPMVIKSIPGSEYPKHIHPDIISIPPKLSRGVAFVPQAALSLMMHCPMISSQGNHTEN
jgi:hypothetical protein